MSVAEKNLARLELSLPPVAMPVAAYVPAVQSGLHVYTSGQLPLVQGELPRTGKVGAEVTVEQAVDLARVCVLNALATIKDLTGDLDRVDRVVKLLGFVASAPDFTAQHAVVDGASKLLCEVFRKAGLHARSAIGVVALPLNAPVELELQVALKA